MEAKLAVLVQFWKTISPWVLGSLIPSIITGLSLLPKTAGAGATLKKFLALLSVLSFKDDDATFKAPLRVTAKKKSKKKVDNVGKDCAAGMALLLIVSLLNGCVPGQPKLENAKQAVIFCAATAVKNAVVSFLPTIISILTNQPVNWQAQLDALKGLEPEAVACATRAAIDQLKQEASAPTTPGAGLEEMKKRAKASNAAKLGEEYLKTLNVQIQDS